MKLLNRIVTPILSLLVFPAIIFLPLFRILINVGLLEGETKTNLLDLLGMGEFISVYDIILLVKENSGEEGGFIKTFLELFNEETKQKLLDLIPATEWLIIFLVAVVIVLLVAVALIFVAAIAKKPGYSVIISALGAGSALFMNFAFNKFASPLLNGAVNVTSVLNAIAGENVGALLEGESGQLIQSILGLLGNAVTVDYMQLTIAYTAILFLFVIALILGITAHISYKNED